ncbi:DNA methyltransferase [Kaistia geumhonensis]|uniref:site-specific DNA-methyltransferase (adenine-specific) n=1 Tax=Kaistia geumhonensis TaxID=410839 RepID=A0ABU0M5R5_9HYPH|nr:DNA methyltransferase [Kaistia geumhonensis]MCX5478472.1 DNA methyltransferase [Kaistia geumhonensis]MDQ0516310.1 DNA modification methylase [Kaistia geumhonensis]
MSADSKGGAYRAFLEAKIKMAPLRGLPIAAESVNPALKPHCRAIVPWLVKGGRRALFAAFGLHKTAMQLETLRQILGQFPGEAALIVLPLGVRQEFIREARERFTGACEVRVKFIRSAAEIEPGVIHLTNYETVRDGKLDPALFTAASLDEASVLRGFGGTKTFREFMRLFDKVRFRFVATATPSPNEFIELLSYAAFLGVMDVGEAKTRFFRRDSEHADQLTLHPHKEQEFWLWVASWALFITKPSDLGFSDEGYELPALDLRWHEIGSDHAAAGEEKDGQGRLLKDSARGLVEAAREKRDSLPRRIERLQAIRAEDPAAHRIIWHDLEAERQAIEKAIPTALAVWGSQDLDEREQRIIDFSDGRFAELAAKPVIAGSGCNFQRHCAQAVFLGIGFKFNDFIQAVHRIQRFGQSRPVRIDLIYTEAEREVRRSLEDKWARHKELGEKMTAIMRDYGLSHAAFAETLTRSLGVERVVSTGENYTLVNNDCVEETARMGTDSVDLIVTSIPFSTQYEYTPSYNDFGHTDDNDHFWAQMDFLTPELLRVLKPGRCAVIHVKDRIVPGGLSGLGFQTVYPFSDATIAHFQKHGFAFLSRITNVTDVVRENAQTYRLGWSEQCKDGSRMGNGMPEYVLTFRKPPTDRSNGYADAPVKKTKRMADKGGWSGEGYSRARWQLDAAGFWRSSGDRLLEPGALVGLDAKIAYRMWKRFNLQAVYDLEHHIAIAEARELVGQLPPDFALLPVHSWHEEVWTDVAQMRSLNTMQAGKGAEKHLCPLPFDIVNRAILQRSEPGETVLDPFGGLMTTPYCAVKLGRKGIGIELNPRYFLDGCRWVEAAAREIAVPTLFDLLGAEASAEGDEGGIAEAAE